MMFDDFNSILTTEVPISAGPENLLLMKAGLNLQLFWKEGKILLYFKVKYFTATCLKIYFFYDIVIEFWITKNSDLQVFLTIIHSYVALIQALNIASISKACGNRKIWEEWKITIELKLTSSALRDNC